VESISHHALFTLGMVNRMRKFSSFGIKYIINISVERVALPIKILKLKASTRFKLTKIIIKT